MGKACEALKQPAMHAETFAELLREEAWKVSWAFGPLAAFAGFFQQDALCTKKHTCSTCRDYGAISWQHLWAFQLSSRTVKG